MQSYKPFGIRLQAFTLRINPQRQNPLSSKRRWRRDASSRTNLGELERFAGPEQGIETPIITQPLKDYAPEPRFDGPTAIVSIILFIILAGIGADRILGLSLWFNRALLKWKENRQYARRVETIEARAKLESAFQDDNNELFV